jgi:hypothetical protein
MNNSAQEEYGTADDEFVRISWVDHELMRVLWGPISRHLIPNNYALYLMLLL